MVIQHAFEHQIQEYSLHTDQDHDKYHFEMAGFLFFIFEGENMKIEPGIQFIQVQHPQIRLKHLYAGHYPNLSPSFFFINLIRIWIQTTVDVLLKIKILR
jgi:hypothetical protein